MINEELWCWPCGIEHEEGHPHTIDEPILDREPCGHVSRPDGGCVKMGCNGGRL